jgi:hypothetical protein
VGVTFGEGAPTTQPERRKHVKARFSFEFTVTADEILRLINRILISVIVLVAGPDVLSWIHAI